MGENNIFKFGQSKTPVILQAENAECGLACLAMVAGYHGYKASLNHFRRRFGVSSRGASLIDIMRAADEIGLSNRALKLPLEDLDKITLPAVLHWNLTHFVVLVKWGKHEVTIHDPSSGKIKVSSDELSKQYTGIALELFPANDFSKQVDKTRLRITDLWSSISGIKRGLIQVLTLSLFLQLYILVSPLFLQIVVDDITQSADFPLLYALAIGFGGYAVLNAIATVVRANAIMHIGSSLSFQVASNIFWHLLKLPLSYVEKRHMGDITSRFKSIEPIRRLLTEGLVSSLMDGSMALTTLIMMFIYSPMLALVSVSVWSIYLLFRLALYARMQRLEETAIHSEALESSLFMETVKRLPALKIFCREYDRSRLWQNSYAQSLADSIQSYKLREMFNASSLLLSSLETVVIVLIAAKLIISAQFSIGMLFAYMIYRNYFSSKASALIERIIEFKVLNLHLNRISDIVLSEPEDVYDQIQTNDLQLTGKLEVRNIYYRYANDSPFIIENLSVTIQAGETVAIIGKTGCGKSTLLKILSTLIRPLKGDIFVDDIKLSTFGIRSYRKKIAFVMQEDDLFSGSIVDNISLFDPNPDMDQIYSVCELACIREEIEALPMKFDSLIGEMGSTFSGGERQRITLARALYGNPQLIFIDEGTSHLDVGTEATINKNLARLSITKIVVAHRPETIKSADRILLFSNGSLGPVDRNIIFEENSALGLEAS